MSETSYTPEEAWFARICVIIGVKLLVDAFLDVATILKIESGLSITSFSTLPESIVVAYAIGSFLAGLYLTAGGGIISLLAYKRMVPFVEIFREYPLPVGTALISVTLRAFGAFQFLNGIFALARYAMYEFYIQPAHVTQKTSPAAIDFAWTLEHFLIAGTLLCFGGIIASCFIRVKKT